MKKILTVVMAAILIFAFTPFAHAQITKDQYYARSTLEGNELEFYDATYDSLSRGSIKRASNFGLSDKRADQIVQYVWRDSPELINYGNRYSGEEEQSLWGQINEATQEIFNLVSDDMTDYEKTEIIFYALKDRIEYDYGALSERVEESQTLVGGLIKGKALCAGISASLQYLLYKIDVPCYVVEGSVTDGTLSHSWNMIKMDGNWYYADLTDYIVNDKTGLFLKGENYMMLTGTTITDNNPPLPACPSNYEPPEPTPAPTPTPQPTEQPTQVNIPAEPQNAAEGRTESDTGILPWVIAGGLAAVVIALVVLLARRKRR